MPRGSLEALAADSNFPALKLATDGAFILSCLGGGEAASGVSALRGIEVLNHKPGRRSTLRYDLLAGDSEFCVIGKWYRDAPQARRMHALHSTLQAAELCLPRPLYSGDEGLFLEELVPGRELRELVFETDTTPFGEAGRWLAALHSSQPPAGLKHKSLRHEIDKASAWGREVAEAVPEWEGAVQATLRGMMRQAEQMEPAMPALIHRDYYPANLLWDGRALWAVDFDQAAIGDPAVDAGTFLGQLEKVAIRDSVEPAAFERQAGAFLDAYSGLSGARLGLRLPFFTAYTFLKLTAAEIARRRPRWRELAGAYLSRAGEEAARSA